MNGLFWNSSETQNNIYEPKGSNERRTGRSWKRVLECRAEAAGWRLLPLGRWPHLPGPAVPIDSSAAEAPAAVLLGPGSRGREQVARAREGPVLADEDAAGVQLRLRVRTQRARASHP